MFLQNLKKMQLNLKLGKISCSTTICERNLVIVNALGKNNDLLFIKMGNIIERPLKRLANCSFKSFNLIFLKNRHFFTKKNNVTFLYPRLTNINLFTEWSEASHEKKSWKKSDCTDLSFLPFLSKTIQFYHFPPVNENFPHFLRIYIVLWYCKICIINCWYKATSMLNDVYSYLVSRILNYFPYKWLQRDGMDIYRYQKATTGSKWVSDYSWDNVVSLSSISSNSTGFPQTSFL